MIVQIGLAVLLIGLFAGGAFASGKCTVDDRSGCGSYVAAVVEYAPTLIPNDGHTTREQALAIMNKNLDAYQDFAAQAVSQNAQIVVFPEYGLSGPAFARNRDSILPYLEPLPPNPKSLAGDVNPCLQPSLFPDSPVLVRASCIAAKTAVTIVLDMGEIQLCNGKIDPLCPSDGRYQFNTLVALSDNGTFLAKYHKTNLYEEPWFDVPVGQPPIWFLSSFGVRFGMMICFDMMWRHPGLDLISEPYHIRDFVFSSWWVNFPPALLAAEMQLAWARKNQVNLLTANSGQSWFNSGSGIYANGDVLATTYNNGSSPMSKLMVAKIPRNPFGGHRLSNHPHPHPPPLSSTPTQQLPSFAMVPFTIQRNMARSLQVSTGNVKCFFNLTTNDNAGDVGAAYVLAAVSGGWWPSLPIEFCGIMSCGSHLETECHVDVLVPVLRGGARLSSFSLQGQFSSSMTVFSLAGSNSGQLMDSLAYEVSTNAQQMNFVQSVSYRSVDDQTVLNIALLGRPL